MNSRTRTVLVTVAAVTAALAVPPQAAAHPTHPGHPAHPTHPAHPGHPGHGAPAATSGAYGFTPSGIDGGGATSTISADPNHPDVLLEGQDTSGIWRSTNGGQSWSPVDVPATGERELFADPISTHIASIEWSPTTTDLVYAAIGNPGSGGGQSGGGVARSTDGGLHWELVSSSGSQPQFAGAGASSSDFLAGLPRSVGNLLAVGGDGHVYGGSYDRGLYRSDATAPTPLASGWTRLCPGVITDDSFIRAVALVPSGAAGTELVVSAVTGGPDKANAAINPGSVWHVTNAQTGTGTCTAIASPGVSGQPQTVEDLAVSGPTVWAAAGDEGVWSWRITDGWHQEKDVAVGSETSWSAVTVSQGTVYAAATKPPQNPLGSSLYDSVLRRDPVAKTWTNIVQSVGDTVVGRTSRWWHSDAGTENHPGQKNTYASSLEVAGNGALYLTGRGGIWRTLDPTGSNPHWDPATKNLNATFSWTVAIDPTDENHVLLGDTDWSVFSSTDGMQTVSQSRPDPDAYLNVHDLAFDATGTAYAATEYLATKTAGGEVYRTTKWTDGKPTWESMGLRATYEGDGCTADNVLGLAAVPNTSPQAVVAAVQGCGVYAWDGSAWSLAGPMATGGKTHRTAFTTVPGTNEVFYYDRNGGVYESLNGGSDFHQVAAIGAAPYVETDGFDTTDYIAAHRNTGNSTTTVYVSTLDGLYALEGVGRVGDHTTTGGGLGSGVTFEKVSGAPKRPGPLTVSGDTLLLTTVAQPSPATGPRTNQPALFRVPLAHVTGAVGTFDDITTATYRAMAQLPHGIQVDSSGRVYVSLRSSGLLIGTKAP